MLRPLLPRTRHCLRIFQRSLHSVPAINPAFKDGVPGLLSVHGFDMAWTQYQSLMIDKLNLVAVGETANQKTETIAIRYARDPASAPIFNYASMAFNNHFFFESLSSTGIVPIPEILRLELEKSFGSIETLRKEFIATANAMFGPGFVWLMRSPRGKYSLLCTYLAGSPFPAAHYRQQPVDMNTEDRTVSESIRRLQREGASNQVGAHGPLSQGKFAPGGADLTPVLCINTWEHVYLADYGVGAGGVGGKKAYAQSWWYAIDWQVVTNRAGPKPSTTNFQI
ncbi:uncharacterized protein L3040_009161 [Drepanopeziza brunnea f. sp. 'multigermtubi']|uniref:uncharacterized protein n=1 Tax=Drepanopeziza brunnea f. sp. 'multigermtubi' TaxID=698441 RepID=UPI00238FA80E|nr:hypothetical protein L3040_009161 [Drepanopeziza brunnea f. sp. 'multigermtubi']